MYLRGKFGRGAAAAAANRPVSVSAALFLALFVSSFVSIFSASAPQPIKQEGRRLYAAGGSAHTPMEPSRAGGDHEHPSDKATAHPAPPDPAPIKACSPATIVNSPDEAPLLVVVTGGSKGIGRSCVESFARRGARVLFTYCSDAAAAHQVEQSFQPAGRVQGRRLDQGDFDSVRAFAAEVDLWREGREIGTVVNNAALGSATVSAYGGLPPPSHSIAAATGEWSGAEDYESARRRADEDMAMMRVNSLGPMWVTEALLPMMMPPKVGGASDEPARIETSAAAAAAAAESQEQPAAGNSPVNHGLGRGGTAPAPRMFLGTDEKKTVLFVGSVGGGSQSVFPGFRVADAMSKAAVAYACKYFAAQNRRQMNGASRGGGGGGVDFVCLCPGATLTDMFRRSTLDKMEAKGPAELERFLEALPQGRLILPEEVGEAVYWLCSSPAATMFHGAVIDASAGLAVRPGVFTEYSF